MDERPEIIYCGFGPDAPGPYAQYLLPHIAKRARLAPEQYGALGAAWRQYAVGAAMVWAPEGEDTARLESLFVDPQARGRGVGSELLRRAAAYAAEKGADSLELTYCLPAGELEAMDAIVRDAGGTIWEGNPIYTLRSADFHDSPMFGWAMTPAFRPAPNVKPFTELLPEQVEALNHRSDIPEILRPSACADLMDPPLSLAWIEDGQVVAYLLSRRSGPGSYAALSGWRSEAAPGDSYVHLLTACANLCYYDAGGDFLYHLSPITKRSEALVHAYVKELSTRMEEHRAEIELTPEEEA